MKRLWDISPAVGPGFPVFPGDSPFTCRWTWTIGAGSPVNVSEITMSPHTGSHTDAPFHYDVAGASIAEVALDIYLGPCRVIDVTGSGAMVTAGNLLMHLDGTPPRVLLRTYQRTPQAWDPYFTAIAPEAIDLLHEHGVRLIGIDTPSVDPKTAKRSTATVAFASTAWPFSRASCSTRCRPATTN
jgi:arylformamidase